ncbi:MAG TPA: hypothetical protein VH595_19465 [Verrucomicrobiae bacterium]|jgi:hypothetical protein|nr:hypothetical protein [Verrucomicrobiae bacterium]
MSSCEICKSLRIVGVSVMHSGHCCIFFQATWLTDGYAALETALKDVLVFAKEEITEEEKKEAKRLLVLAQQAIYWR